MNVVPLPVTGSKAGATNINLTFGDFWRLGYRRLIPVVPPGADIREGSSLYKRVGTPQDGRGKIPGIRDANGRWGGFDWTKCEADESDLERWQNWGASVGCKMGGGLVAIDADTLDKTLAALIQQTVIKHFSVLPCRLGNFPKALYPVRVNGPMPYKRVEFGENERVEILSEGRQAVFRGTHPKTSAPYLWAFPLVPFDQLPVATPQQLTAFLEELRSILPAAKPVITEGAGKEVDQASLRGDLETVRRAVEATPNTSEAFPSRDHYRNYGYAIKAALPDHPQEAFEMFAAWCERWTENGEPAHPGNDPRVIEADWGRMRPPFRRGASWLYELAEEHSGGQFKRADAWFDEIPGEPTATPALKLQPTPYRFPAPADIPARQWLYGDHYARGYVSATVAPGGLGKSSLTIVEALAMASGKPLLGVEPKGRFRVWLWNGEDPMDELNRRVAAAMLHYGLTKEDIEDRLWLDSGHAQEIILATETRNGAAIVEGTSAAIVGALRENKIDVLVIDPFVSSHRVSENDNGAIDLVVKRLGKIAVAANMAVEVVHHVRKTNGVEVTVEDARGASALVYGARLNRALTRMTADEGRKLGVTSYWHYWRFGGVTKTNITPASASPAETATWYTMKSVPLGNGTGGGLDAIMNGDEVGVVAKAGLENMSEVETSPDQTSEALRRIAVGEWRVDIRARDAWVGNPVAQAFGLDATDKADQGQINGILKRLLQGGLIQHESRRDRSRHTRIFVRVTAAGRAPNARDTDGVFG
ncbi:AAA family ATPase [Bradyrhizobium brasilense]|uniref:AAA family ATPase n=1 Tax=Bradyrhizobium brasilense TaxID=1419277 RepID=UPI002877253F|nr:AAA family ATPase [Bradyrhizobium brasilense]MCP3417787.1 AAA family ATPase [Bradyrhizobium brasilense]